MSKNKVLGEISRFGQSKNSGCCGAAKIGLSKLISNEIIEGDVNEYDYQMNTIEQILYKEKNRVINSENKLYEATEVIYDAIDKRINELVEKTNYNCKFIILMGAILINSDFDMGSFTDTRRFDVINLETSEKKSYLDNYLSNSLNKCRL